MLRMRKLSLALGLGLLVIGVYQHQDMYHMPEGSMLTPLKAKSMALADPEYGVGGHKFWQKSLSFMSNVVKSIIPEAYADTASKQAEDETFDLAYIELIYNKLISGDVKAQEVFTLSRTKR